MTTAVYPTSVDKTRQSRCRRTTTSATCDSHLTQENASVSGSVVELIGLTDLNIERQDLPEDEIDYPGGINLCLVTVALCLSVFCTSLDNTIIATAIPRITDQFKTLSDVGWYGSAYLLTTCTFQLIYGKLYTFFSIKWVYLVALFIFELGSFICGVAPTSSTLIVGRAIAGLGSAGIFSGAVLIISKTVPLQSRPTYTGLIGATYGISSVAGPLLGGLFTDKVTWRWCFYVNLPFGAITGAFILWFFEPPKVSKSTSAGWHNKLRELDIPGTCIFIPAVVCVLLALQWGGSKYEWNSSPIISLFVVSGVSAISFVGIQLWREDRATVPPRVFAKRTVWASAWFSATLGAAFFVLTYYIPIYFQAIKGASAVKSGMMNLPMILGLVILSLIAGVGVTLTGHYVPFMLLSSLLMAIGSGLLTTFNTTTTHPAWIGYQFIFGAGVGLGMQQTLIAVQATLSSADIPIGTAIMMFSQTLGGSLFISVAQNVFTNQLIKNLAHTVPDGSAELKGLVLGTGATALRGAITAKAPQLLQLVLNAYCKAITQTWYISVATSTLSSLSIFFVQWTSVKGKEIAMGGGA